MCACKEPKDCHRTVISKYLNAAFGVNVVNIQQKTTTTINTNAQSKPKQNNTNNNTNSNNNNRNGAPKKESYRSYIQNNNNT
jgi:hypothetical protein